MAILNEVKYWSVLFALVSLSVLAQCSSRQEEVFVLENKDCPEKKTIVIIVKTDEQTVECVVISNKMYVEDIVSSPGDYVQMKLPGKTIRNIIKECATQSKPRKRRESAENDKEENCNDGDCGGDNQIDESQYAAEQNWNIIFPGTKWCGSGSIAKDYNDLGILKDTDMCCRSHDNCNEYIVAGETKFNITNNSGFTLLSCQCDDNFYNCLSGVNSIASNTIGRTYFNILQRSCLTQDYPLSTTCKTYWSFLKLNCKEYEKNTTVPKVYMLRPAKRYELLPLPIVG